MYKINPYKTKQKKSFNDIIRIIVLKGTLLDSKSEPRDNTGTISVYWSDSELNK